MRIHSKFINFDIKNKANIVFDIYKGTLTAASSYTYTYTEHLKILCREYMSNIQCLNFIVTLYIDRVGKFHK